MKYVALCLIVFVTCLTGGCMYSIHVVHTQGEASDIIDDNAAPEISTDANVQIPATGAL